MAIDALVPLSLPILRMILRLLNPANERFADAVEDLEDLLGSIKDRGERREARRHLEHIADQVLKRLDRFVSVEYRDLDQGELSAASIAAAGAIEAAAATDLKTIVGVDLSAKLLEATIRERVDLATQFRDLSSSGEELAYTLLREISYYVVELAQRYPEFTLESFRQLLARTTSIMTFLEDVRSTLNDLPGAGLRALKTEDQNDEDRRYREYEVDYLRSILHDYDKLELYGLDLSWDVRRYSLTTGYLSLRVRSDERQANPQSIDEVLQVPGVTVIQGLAGAGKTTILQWLAVTAAKKGFSGSLSQLNGCVPFFVRLRHFAQEPLPALRLLPHLTTDSTIVDEPDGWFADVIKSRTPLILIDGVDELPEDKYPDLLAWLESLMRTCDTMVLVVTSRPSAATAADAIGRGLPIRKVSVELLPLDRDEIKHFVLHWHKAIAVGQLDRNNTDIESRAPRVASQILSKREYRLLASSPLLCAVLCALSYVRAGVLPETRLSIYETLLRMLLGPRDIQRNVRAYDVPLSIEQKLLVLEDLADLLLENDLSEIDDERTCNQIERSLGTIHGVNTSALDVYRYLISRSGVVRNPAPTRVDFVHRTFLEYLAAGAQIRNDRVESLANRVLEPTWNEAVVLAAGRGIRRQTVQIVDSVLNAAEARLAGRRATDGQDITLIATCASFLETCSAMPGELYQRVLKVVAHAIPPRSTAEARAVAASGDALVPHLVAALQRNTIQHDALVTSIRTLGDIGTDSALNGLSQIPARFRLRAIADLVAVWPWFDLEEFSDSVLRPLRPTDQEVTVSTSVVGPYLGRLSKEFKWHLDIEFPEEAVAGNLDGAPVESLSIRNLNLVGHSDGHSGGFLWSLPVVRKARLSGLCGFARPPSAGRGGQRLYDLSLSLNGGVVNSADIATLPSLGRLEIFGEATVVDVNALGEIPGLRELSFAGSLEFAADEADMSLSSLWSLDWLDVEDVATLIKIVEGAPNLYQLVIDHADGISDLSFLSGCSGLEVLELVDLPNLSDISTLLELDSLRELRLAGSHSIGSAGVLGQLRASLTELDVEQLEGTRDLMDELLPSDYDEFLSDEEREEVAELDAAGELTVPLGTTGAMLEDGFVVYESLEDYERALEEDEAEDVQDP